MLKWLSEKLFPNDGDGNTQAPPVSPEFGAAGCLIEAVHRDGAYTEVEREIATKAIMKLFDIDHAAATVMRSEAETLQKNATTMMGFAAAARALDVERKESLIKALWTIIDSNGEAAVPETQLVRSIIDVLGISQERATTLRPQVSKE